MKIDVTVVGAGIIGLGCARALAKAGYRVLVVDRNQDDAVTDTAAGFISPIFHAGELDPRLTKLAFESLRMWEPFAMGLQNEATNTVDFRKGTLHVALNSGHHQLLEQINVKHREYGVSTRFLDRVETKKLVSGVSDKVHSSLFIDQDRQVNPRLVKRLLKQTSKELKVQFVNGSVTRIHPGEVEINGGTVVVETRATLITGGAYSAGIEGLIPPEPVQNVRGQNIVVHCEDPLADFSIRTPDIYLSTRRSGIVTLGSTTEDAHRDLTQTCGSIMNIMRRSCLLFPGLFDAKFVEVRSGFRVVPKSGLPIVRADDDRDDLFYASGHGRRGILLAPWTIDKITNDMITFLTA